MLLLPKRKIPFKEIIPKGFIDIHSHLLPGIDDGVTSKYKTAIILEEFAELGINKIITTPHIIQEIWPNTTALIEDKLCEIRLFLQRLDITKVQINAGAEYMLDSLLFERLKNKDILPLHKNYILVEMSTFNAPLNLSELLFEIKLAGYIPILAHPERYFFYHQNLKKYDELKASGFKFQLNLLSLSGYYGEDVKRIALKLLNKDLFDYCGSDIHNHLQLRILKKGFTSKTSQKIIPILKRNALFV